MKGGWPTWLASYIDEAAGDIPDKLITVVVAVLIYQGLPNRFRNLFSLFRRPQDEVEAAPAPSI